MNTPLFVPAALLAASTFALTGCAPSSADFGDQADAVAFTDGWVKASPSGMTALFGTLSNDAEYPLQLDAVDCSDYAAMTELHETVTDSAGSSMMQEKDGGFSLAAGDALQLKPGGNHVMLMQLKGALEPGSDVTCTLQFGDKSTKSITVPVKEFSGANENYKGDMDMSTPMPTH